MTVENNGTLDTPNSPEGQAELLVLKAQKELNLLRTKEGLELLQQVIKEFPQTKAAETAVRLKWLNLPNGKEQPVGKVAEEFLQKGIEIHTAGDPVKALKIYQFVATYYSTTPAGRTAKEYLNKEQLPTESGEEAAQRKEQQNREYEQKGNELFDQAMQAQKENKSDEAILIYEQLVKGYPLHKATEQGLLNLAKLYAEKEETGREKGGFIRFLGDAFNFNKNYYVRAVKSFETFIEMNPNSPLKPFIWYNMAEACLKDIEDDRNKNRAPAFKAIECYSNIIEQAPGSKFEARALEGILRARHLIAENELEAARTWKNSEKYRAAVTRLQLMGEEFDDILNIHPELKAEYDELLAESTRLNLKYPTKDQEPGQPDPNTVTFLGIEL